MSKKYLSWVRSWPCVGCGSHLTEAHHMRELALGAGMGKKATNKTAILRGEIARRKARPIFRSAKVADRAYRCGAMPNLGSKWSPL